MITMAVNGLPSPSLTARSCYKCPTTTVADAATGIIVSCFNGNTCECDHWPDSEYRIDLNLSRYKFEREQTTGSKKLRLNNEVIDWTFGTGLYININSEKKRD